MPLGVSRLILQFSFARRVVSLFTFLQTQDNDLILTQDNNRIIITEVE